MTFLRWLASLFLHRRLERDMQEEMREHIEQATERLMARGLSRDEARRAAQHEFGNVHYLQERARDVRGSRWAGTLSPDAKLAVRMLVKNPFLSVVGGLGMAVAICIAIGFFTWMTFYYSDPPIEDGDRVVTVAYIDGDVAETTIHDYVTWKDEVRTLEDLGAYRRREAAAESDQGGSSAASVIEMTASGFRLARVPPLLGRPLLESDELEGAARVVVIGFDEWQRWFGGDSGVVGAEILLDGQAYSVVGVMPEGFRFPSNDGIWTALGTDVTLDRPDFGELVFVFGRLAPGIDGGAAEAEVTAITERMPAEDTRSRERFRLVVVPFIRHILDVEQYPAWVIWLAQLFGASILVLVAVNVAVLVYARTALRTGEMVVRTALGATRTRIVSQLFLEALALSLAAAALGLVMAEIAFQQMTSLIAFQERLPYWLFGSLPAEAVLYSVGLAFLAAFVVGVLPGFQATGRNLQSTLRSLGGGSGLRLGRSWTLLICTQVTVAVGILPAVVGVAWNSVVRPTPNFPASEMIWFRTPSAPTAAAAEADFANAQAELLRRVDALPEVVGVTFASSIPRRFGNARAALDVTDDSPMPATPIVATHSVDPDFFELLGVPLVAGRWLNASDAAEGATTAVVSQSFVDEYLGGGNALGRRFRESTAAGDEIAPDAPSFEIVGVVEDMFVFPDGGAMPATFHAMALGSEPVTFLARARGVDPASLATPLRTLVDEVGLGRGLTVTPMGESYGSGGGLRLTLVIVGVITLSVLLLSAAGISAMMSFAVTRRQREIGVRTALGATKTHVIASIFKRSAGALTVGALLGATLAVLVDLAAGGELLGGQTVPLLTLVGSITLLSGALATMVPARRALRLQAMDLMRGE